MPARSGLSPSSPAFDRFHPERRNRPPQERCNAIADVSELSLECRNLMPSEQRYRNINYFNYFICKSDTGGGYGIGLDAGYVAAGIAVIVVGARKPR